MKGIKQLLMYSVVALLMIAMVSCAPKIYGARKHRKDKNCGCENVCPQKIIDSNVYVAENK